MTPQLESSVEKYMRRKVHQELGGRLIKLLPGTDDGIPDRMALLPGGRIILVELKQEGKTPDPLQKVWHQKAARLGITVDVVAGKAEVDQWIERHRNQ